MEEQIRKCLEDNFTIIDLKIKNESHKHRGHAGDDGSGQTHFSVEVAAQEFVECSRVQCQRMVNAAVKGLFDKGLHAFALKVKGPGIDRS